MQLENSILEARILLHETDFPGFLSINRCADKLQILKNNINDDTFAIENFVKEAIYFKLEMGKLNRNFRTCDSEAANYKATAQNVTTEIQKARDDILTLQSDLARQEEIRIHRENLEVIALTVNRKENKSSLKRKIASVEDSIKSLDDSIAAADIHLQIRARHFDNLMESIAVMQGDVVREEGDDKSNDPTIEDIGTLDMDGEDSNFHQNDDI